MCRQVLVAPHVQDFAIQLVMATQPDQKEAHELARNTSATAARRAARRRWWSAAACCALMRGRFHLAVEDILHVAPAVLRHRIILNFDAHADGQTPETILQAIHQGRQRPDCRA